MQDLTPTALGVLMFAVVGTIEVAKLALRVASRKINGHTGHGQGAGHVHKADLVALRHEISRDLNESVSSVKSYIQEQFREFGERMARIEQRVDDHEKRQ